MSSALKMKIGVLALQGAVSEHLESVNLALKENGSKGQATLIKKPSMLEEAHGLIIPGGESTTIGRLSQREELLDRLVAAAKEGMPIFGTCAGQIMLAKEVSDAKLGQSDQSTLSLMDIKVLRNAFGRQIESFETELSIPVLGDTPFPAVFIRAPIIEKVWGQCEVLARYEDKVVAAQQGNMLVSSFHPELTRDLRMHKYFLKMVEKSPMLS